MTFSLDQILWYLGLFSTALFLLKLIVFITIGGDMEVETDFDSLSESDSSFSFLSVQTILAFFMGFSWMGLFLIDKFNFNLWINIIISLLIGIIFMFATAYLMFLVKKLDKKVVVKLEDYIGTEGKSYTNFKPLSEGKIQIVINNKLMIIDAINSEEEEINSFCPIKIEKVIDKKVYIKKI